MSDQIDRAITGAYTRGPWQADWTHIRDAQGNALASCEIARSYDAHADKDDAPLLANARLMAAAPALAAAYREQQEQLRVAKEALEAIALYRIDWKVSGPENVEAMCLIADEALAKLEGGQDE